VLGVIPTAATSEITISAITALAPARVPSNDTMMLTL